MELADTTDLLAPATACMRARLPPDLSASRMAAARGCGVTISPSAVTASVSPARASGLTSSILALAHPTSSTINTTCRKGTNEAGKNKTMKTQLKLLASFHLLSAVCFLAHAATTIDPANKYAYGANFGWLDWRGDTNTGVIIGAYVCSGYIYSANVGWINLGSGSPANGIQYQNNSAMDFGVNQDGLGNLRGYAYGANIGWINFENTGAPTVDLRTGNLSGSVWSANCGWISLSNAVAFVQTDSFWPGVLDANGLPLAWELTYFGATGVDPNADPDHDGQSNLQEYLAGTNPTNTADVLEITAYTTSPGGTTNV